MKALAIALVVTACSAQAPEARWAHWENDSTAACFPIAPKVSEVNEGPFARALIAAAHVDGARYEVARFRLTRTLSADQRASLMAQVEKGLLSRPGAGAVETGTLFVGSKAARVLSVRLDGDRQGRWLVFYDSPVEMLQVSVVGPAAGSHRAWRFLASFGASECDGLVDSESHFQYQ